MRRLAPVGDRTGARTLSIHAVVVGWGWFLVAFAGMVGVATSEDMRLWVERWPPAVQGAGITVLMVAAFPPVWPLYIALGWYESGLAHRVGSGDQIARRQAHRILILQAVVFLLIAPGAAGLARSYGHLDDFMALTWVPLAVIGCAHLLTAIRIR